MKTGNIITVLDIGSSKVCCCIASVANDGSFSILGIGYCICLGVKSGIITDIRSVEKSIAKAIEIAEQSANFQVKTVYVNISGKNITSKIIAASMNIGGRVIKNDDIMQLVSVNNDEDDNFEVIHAIPIMFTVDSQISTKDPIGMRADSLDSNINIVCVTKKQINNLITCLTRCHLEISGIILSCYASGLSLLTKEEENENCIVIDFGAGTTSIAFFYEGTLCGAEIIPMGGNNITNDIAIGLNITKAGAERIKALHGAAFVSMDDNHDTILIPVQEDENIIDLQQITKYTLNNIIQSRVEEILNAVKEKIENSIFAKDFCNSQIIITGGGSQLTGIKDFASTILQHDVIMRPVSNNHSIDSNIQIDNGFSVVFGIINFAHQTEFSHSGNFLNSNDQTVGFFRKIHNWFKNNW